MKIIDRNYAINKKIRHDRIVDKENIQANINQKDNFNTHQKISVKTGIQIRNRIKNNKEKIKQTLNRILPSRKNSFINQKSHNQILKQKQLNRADSFTLSNASSTKSFKSVTFSTDYQDNNKSLSNSTCRKTSILKNKINRQNHLNQTQKKSIASSFCSHIKTLDQSVENQSSNSIIIQKYQKILKQLNITHQKYTDPIYPPCESSLFLKNPSTSQFLSQLNHDGYKIKWIRLTQLYKNHKLCIFNPHIKSFITRGFINSTQNKDNNFIQNVFNSICNKKYMMQKIFQSQQICEEGIYYIKMHQTQTNSWKYVIVDDYVPVVVKKNSKGQEIVVKPAFLNVLSKSKYSSQFQTFNQSVSTLKQQQSQSILNRQHTQQNQQQQNLIQIWPFLLQKAYAKYYSTYDTLLQGNTLDFLQQVTGSFYNTYELKDLPVSSSYSSSSKYQRNQTEKQISKLINNQFNIKLGQTPNGLFYPFNVIESGDVEILDVDNQNCPANYIKIEQLSGYFQKVHIIQANRYSFQKNCLIKQQNLLEKQLKQQKKPFIMRNFTISQSTQCHIAIIQKQQRFHRLKSKKRYQYSWIRMMLAMKQNSGYRWIDSAYGNTKTIKIQTNLELGQYFIIIIPEWNTKPSNINLSLCTNNCQTTIERKSYEDHMNIIEQSCMDLAQRYGRLIQINQNICAYNYIDYKIGFIIQNINNQKHNGEVKILRTIDGLEQYNIVPIHQQFYINKKLQIKIKSLESYTVVLKVLNGVDRNFLQQFDFGS